jgi:hypothetical protein
MTTMTNSEQQAVPTRDVKVRDDSRGESLTDYWPLIVLVSGSALAAWALCEGFTGLEARPYMHAYMGTFLFVFALLKLFNLSGFQDGFSMYDLLAGRVTAYGYVYPFLELILALTYLAYIDSPVVYWATIGLFGFGAIGVVNALRTGLDINCPCMGSVLNVPLSTVTLTEDLGMVAMAAALLVM